MRRAEFLMLLLTCKLGRKLLPLTQGEYRRFAQYIKESPQLFGEEPMSHELLLQLGCDEAEAEKILKLLQTEREAWQYLQARPDVIPITRLSEVFPAKLRRLQECPSALFCLGDISLLQTPMISLVGNRLLSAEAAEFAARIGCLAAQEGYTLVSGGANGADSVAQNACLRAGGNVICILPQELPLRAEEHILYCCDEDYAQSFHSRRALRRNHYIHALGERTYVAQCLHCTGGTWEGCRDNLNRSLSPLYVCNDGSEGATELLSMGAIEYAI